MILIYIATFILLVLFSAFFSSAETSLLSLNKIRLNLRANKKEKKALVLTKILEDPEEFFSTILIGNNFVNVAAASISTVLFTKLVINEELSLLLSTLVTTVIILFFAEIIPKSYAFRYNEKISDVYAYPIKFFTFLFYPFVKITTFFSRLLFREKEPHVEEKGLSIEEIKHFLSSQKTLIRYNPNSLRMMNEVINITQKDIKSIMTPRVNLIAMKESDGIDELKRIILEKKISKVLVYRETLDNITGVIHSGDVLAHLLEDDLKGMEIGRLQKPPIFLSEFSALNYALNQFKKHQLNIAVVIDEFGATIGILTINDIFSEILGEIEISKSSITKIRHNVYKIMGNIPVDEVNDKLHLGLPEKTEYTTMSGLFIYHFGKFPRVKQKVRFENFTLVVRRMGDRKIEELLLIRDKE